MRAVTISLGLVATVLIAGCAAKPTQGSAQNSANSAAVNVAPAAAVTQTASEQPVATQAAAAAPAEAKDDEMICRNEKLLGTRISKRVCKTAAQRKMEEKSAREMMKGRDQKGGLKRDPIMGEG